MKVDYFEEMTFEAKDFSETGLPRGEYENCSFINCNLSNADLSNTQFIDCVFRRCNLSMAKTAKTVLNNVRFDECKILGINFENCNESLFSIIIDNCILNFSSFFKLKLKKTLFKNSSLHEVDFTQADLTSAVIDNCDLKGAKFENTILEKADFRSAYNYSIDPELNVIKKAKFSLSGIVGLLDKYNIEVS